MYSSASIVSKIVLTPVLFPVPVKAHQTADMLAHQKLNSIGTGGASAGSRHAVPKAHTVGPHRPATVCRVASARGENDVQASLNGT